MAMTGGNGFMNFINISFCPTLFLNTTIFDNVKFFQIILLICNVIGTVLFRSSTYFSFRFLRTFVLLYSGSLICSFSFLILPISFESNLSCSFSFHCSFNFLIFYSIIRSSLFQMFFCTCTLA